MIVTTRVRHHTPADRSVLVNGVRIDPVTAKHLPAVIERFLRCGRSHTVNFLSVDPAAIARGDEAYRRLLNESDLNLPEGMPVAWGVRLMGVTAERVTGADALLQLSKWGLAEGIRHYYFGGGADVADMMSARLRLRFPGLRVSGTEPCRSRSLNEAQLDEAAAWIRSTSTDLLWIGIGGRKQHVIAAELAAREAAPVVLAVGSAFDFLAGVEPTLLETNSSN